MYTQHEFNSLIKMPRLNFAERNRLLGVLAFGVSRTVVAGQYNVSISTLSRLVERVNVTGTADDRPRSAASRVASIRQDSMIRQRHLRNRFVTVQTTSHGNRGRPIHRDTVITRLIECGIHCRRPA